MARDPGIDQRPGPPGAVRALREQVWQPGKAVQPVGDMFRGQGERPWVLAGRQRHARHADAPDAAHQRFAAQEVRRDNIGKVEGEALWGGGGLLQALQDADLDVFAAGATEAAPQRGIVGAGPGPFSERMAVSTCHGTGPIP